MSSSHLENQGNKGQSKREEWEKEDSRRRRSSTVMTMEGPLELGGVRGGEEGGEAVEGGDGGAEDGANRLEEDAALDDRRRGERVNVEEVGLEGDGLVRGPR